MLFLLLVGFVIVIALAVAIVLVHVSITVAFAIVPVFIRGWVAIVGLVSVIITVCLVSLCPC